MIIPLYKELLEELLCTLLDGSFETQFLSCLFLAGRKPGTEPKAGSEEEDMQAELDFSKRIVVTKYGIVVL